MHRTQRTLGNLGTQRTLGNLGTPSLVKEESTEATSALKIVSLSKDLSLMQQLLFPFLFLTTPSYSTTQPIPKILSALYGYDGCIGGVNSFSTEEEYLQELKRFVFLNFATD